MRKSVLGSLESVSLSTEAVYLRMGEAFPALIRELEANFGGSEETRGARSVREELSRTIAETQQIIQTYDTQFTADHQESEGMLDLLQKQLVSLESLGTQIEAIREDSILMELISLNAMVIAAKAGEAGRAFSCITSELKQLSNQTMVLTDQLSRGDQALGAVFTEFMDSLTALNTRETEGFTRFLTRIREVFHELKDGTDRLLGGLEQIRTQSEQVKVPLGRIMVEIQNQDRIRQGIDHVLLSLHEFQAAEKAASLEVRLDELSFLEILPELSSLVLEEVAGQILGNRNSFHRSLAEARELMARLEQERQQVLTEHLETRGRGSLEEGFRAGEELFSEFVAQTEGLLRSREGIQRKSALLQKNVGALVGSLESFDFILSKFRNIDLASRIQVARHAALASMRDNATEMTALTRRIETDVGGSITLTSGFFATVEALFQNYRNQANLRIRQDGDFNGLLRDSIQKLKSAKAFLSQSVLEGKVFNKTFTDLFAATEADLGTLDTLIADIGRQKDNLGAIKARITDQKRELMAANGIREWKLENQKLKTMIDRFTIFTHKKFAAELGQFEVEAGVESGEVTLF